MALTLTAQCTSFVRGFACFISYASLPCLLLTISDTMTHSNGGRTVLGSMTGL